MVLTDMHPNAARVQLELIRSVGHARRAELMNRYSQELIHASKLSLLKKHQGNEVAAKLERVRIQYSADLEQKGPIAAEKPSPLQAFEDGRINFSLGRPKVTTQMLRALTDPISRLT